MWTVPNVAEDRRSHETSKFNQHACQSCQWHNVSDLPKIYTVSRKMWVLCKVSIIHQTADHLTYQENEANS